MRADNPATRKPTSFRERFFHAPDSATWEGDSYRGIHTAKRRGYRRIDVNTLRTLDGVSAAFHWMRPLRHGYYDPKGLLRGDVTVDQLTWAALSRLRPRRAPSYRVRTVQQMFALAASLGVGIELELKNSRWKLEEALALKGAADKLGVWVIVKTLSSNSNARHNLAVFHRVGFTTVVLPRGLRRIPRSWWPVVDHVRGPVIWTGAAPMTAFKAPEPTFLAARWHGGPQDPRGGIIRIHSTVSPCQPGQARAVAEYFAREQGKTSAHYTVDCSTRYADAVVQCVGDHDVSWDCGWNPPGISIEMCEYPGADIGRWGDPQHRQLMKNTVRLTAELCLAYNIRPWYVGWVQLRMGVKGITTHAQVSKAYPRLTDHTDPGSWRRYRFMRAVRAQIKQIRKEAA